MKRFLTSAAAAAMLVAGTGSGARAQTVFDLGVYGGGQWSSNWFSIGDEGLGVGPGPIFGAAATFWTTPTFGVRLHGSYFPTGQPQDSDENFGDAEENLNNWFADLDLVFLFSRPGQTDQGMDHQEWFARLAQRLIGTLGALLDEGRLYEVDTAGHDPGSVTAIHLQARQISRKAAKYIQRVVLTVSANREALAETAYLKVLFLRLDR